MKKVVDSENGLVDVFSVNHKRTFCHINDAVEMIRLLAESTQTIGKSYNIGNDDEEITIGDLAQKIINLIGKDVVINPLETTQGSPGRRYPKISKLKKVISYIKQNPLEKGLQDTFDWYSQNVFSGDKISAI